jgi:hypothetical protein
VYPSIGNHDADETEACDDRTQVEDNFYLRERLAGEDAAGRASFGPGLFYRFRYGSDIEFVCLDTSKEAFFTRDRLFALPKHWEFLDASLPAEPDGVRWRVPFAHHPPFSAGPRHHNTRSMEKLLPLFQRAGVKAMFSGHEHNFQHSHHEGIDYFVTGGAGRTRTEPPDRFEAAHTRSWSNACHFLLAAIDGDQMTVRAIGESRSETSAIADIVRYSRERTAFEEPIVIRRDRPW